MNLTFPDFSDKVLLVYLVGRPLEDAVVLKRPRFDVQGTKAFLVGQFADGTTPNDWATDVPTAISWDNVEQYMVFESLEDYFTRISMTYDKENMH